MHRAPVIAIFLLLFGALPLVASSADEDTTARVREMLRRTQEVLRQAQSDNADLVRAKSDAELKLKAASEQIDAAKSGSKAAQVALNAKLTSAQGTQAQLEQKLNETTERLTAANAKQVETAKQLAAREADLTQVKQTLDQSKTANASCEDKNMKLYGYAEAVLERYKNKGVWAAMSQKDPLFGLKDVEVQNVVQEYQQKFNSQKVKP